MIVNIAFTDIVIIKKKNANFSFKSKYSFLIEFCYGLEIFDRLDPQKRHTHTK